MYPVADDADNIVQQQVSLSQKHLDYVAEPWWEMGLSRLAASMHSAEMCVPAEKMTTGTSSSCIDVGGVRICAP